jgi:hypothetical protein
MVRAADSAGEEWARASAASRGMGRGAVDAGGTRAEIAFDRVTTTLFCNLESFGPRFSGVEQLA